MLIALPALVVIGVLVIAPTVQAAYYSFTNWNGLTASSVGFSNYASSIFSGPGVQRILFNNLVLLVSVPFAVLVEYSVAYALWRGVRGRTAFRILYFIPVTVSWAVVGIVFRSVLLEFDPTWLTSATASLLVLLAAFHWALFGINVLIIFAGLSTVDPSLLEAATVDGASPLRIMLRIVGPQARSFIDFVVMTTLILSLTNIFGLVYAFNLGGPGFATTTLEFNLYQDGFTNGNFGLAAATGILLMLVAMIASLVSVVPTVRRIRK